MLFGCPECIEEMERLGIFVLLGDSSYLEAALPPLLVEHLGAFNGAIATETLALARIQTADMVSNGK